MKRMICILTSLLMLTTVVVGSSVVADDWPTYMHDNQRTGQSDAFSPIISEDAIDLIGTISTGIQGSPAVVGGNIYVGGTNGRVYCFDVNGGGLLWETSALGAIQFSSPTVKTGKLYIGTYTKYVHCIDTTNGDIIWTSEILNSKVYSAPTIYQSKVYVTTDGAKLYCLNGADGSILWSQGLLAGSGCKNTPAIYSNKVYISLNSHMFCFNADTGAEQWHSSLYDFDYTPPFKLSSPSIDNGKVFAGNFDGTIFCYDAATGEILWQSSDSAMGQIVSTPAVSDDRIYVMPYYQGEGKPISCFDADDGDLIWSYETLGGSNYGMSPILAGKNVYVMDMSASFYCLDAMGDGDESTILLEQIDFTGNSYSTPAITDDGLFTTTTDGSSWGNIYKIAGENQAPTTPEIKGPERGRVNITYLFTVDNVEDPEGDDIYYQFQFGDGTITPWIGPFISGEDIKIPLEHAWKKPGDYTVHVQAKDMRGTTTPSVTQDIHIDFLEINAVSGGLGISAMIKNAGHFSKDINWTVELIGGTFPGFHINKRMSGSLESVNPGESTVAQTPMIVALGKFKIVITATCPGEKITETFNGTALFFYMII